MRELVISVRVKVKGEDRAIAKKLHLLREFGERLGIVLSFGIEEPDDPPPLRDELASLEREIAKPSPAYRA